MRLHMENLHVWGPTNPSSLDTPLAVSVRSRPEQTFHLEWWCGVPVQCQRVHAWRTGTSPRYGWSLCLSIITRATINANHCDRIFSTCIYAWHTYSYMDAANKYAIASAIAQYNYLWLFELSAVLSSRVSHSFIVSKMARVCLFAVYKLVLLTNVSQYN